MNKILSIIIPTYNMEALLPRCLDSLVSARNADKVEAIVVNDGSKDGSLAVGRDYESRYPDTVVVIDKPNGNYGSTINAALPVARGKYVKVLDSDDWFDTAALEQFIDTVEPMEVDMVVTPFSQTGAEGRREVIRYNTMGREPYDYGRVYSLDSILPDGYIRFFLMHALAYRTQLLRDMDYRQTEGISYTDTEWACLPVYHAQTILFLDINLYQYNLDREGQTMDPRVLLKCIDQLGRVTDRLVDYYDQHAAGLSAARRAFMKQYMENRLRIMYKLYLLDMPRADFRAADLEELDRKYTDLCRRHDFHVRLYPENKVLRIEYINYWHRHHSRWPVWLERLNAGVDHVAKWVYAKTVRRK